LKTLAAFQSFELTKLFYFRSEITIFKSRYILNFLVNFNYNFLDLSHFIYNQSNTVILSAKMRKRDELIYFPSINQQSLCSLPSRRLLYTLCEGGTRIKEKSTHLKLFNALFTYGPEHSLVNHLNKIIQRASSLVGRWRLFLNISHLCSRGGRFATAYQERYVPLIFSCTRQFTALCLILSKLWKKTKEQGGSARVVFEKL